MTRNGHHTFFSLPLHAAPAPSKYSHWPPPDLVQVIFPLQGNVKRIVYLHIHYLFGSFKLGVDALLFLCSWAGNRRGETRHRTQKGVRKTRVTDCQVSVHALCRPLVGVRGEALPSGTAPHPPCGMQSLYRC